MKAHVLGAIAAAALLAAGGVAYASQPLVTADVPVQFTVEGHTFAAGSYVISTIDAANPEVLEFRQEKTGKVALVESTTRLAARDNGRSTLVFDEAGSQHVLSELHVDGTDGYYFAGVKAEHTHRSIAAKHKS